VRRGGQPYDYLVVLDFEWTCDNRRLPGPPPPLEIIEFPSVLVRAVPRPARAVDEFQAPPRPGPRPPP
jgi:inhibitor of KinA sporulation pathway (predicted exonuclease)